MTQPGMTAWDDLPQSVRERLVMLVGALREFRDGYGMIGRLSLSGTSGPKDSRFRFLYNALHSYLHGLYAASGDHGALPVLRAIGLGRVADQICERLDETVGTTTVRGALTEWRNTVIAHPSFSLDIVERRAITPVGFDDPQASKPYGDAIAYLLDVTVALYNAIRDAYPALGEAGPSHE